MTDADDKDHTVEVGTWWWARLESGASPEAVRIARHGVEVVGSELGCAYRWAVLLEPVVPYVPAGVAPRSPRYDPRPGDTKTWSTSNAWGPYTVQVVGVQPRGDVDVEYMGEDAVFGRFTLDAALWADDRGGTARWTAG